MAQNTFKKVRLFKILRELNISEETVLQYLDDEGFSGALKGKGLNASITDEDAYYALYEAFASDGEIATRVREKKAARVAEDTDQPAGDGSPAEVDKVVPTEEAVPVEEAVPAEETVPVEEAVPAEEAVPVEEAVSAEEAVAEPTETEPGFADIVNDSQSEDAATGSDAVDSDADSMVVEPETEQPTTEEQSDPVEEGQEIEEPVDATPDQHEETLVEESIAEAEAENDQAVPVESEEAPLEEGDAGIESEETDSESAEMPEAVEAVSQEPSEIASPEVTEENEVAEAAAGEVDQMSEETATLELVEPDVDETEQSAIDTVDITSENEAPEPEEIAEPVIEQQIDEVEEATAAVEEDDDEEAGEEESISEGEIAEGEEDDENIVSASRYKLTGTTVIGKIDLGAIEESSPKKKRKRKRKRKKAEDEKPETASGEKKTEAPAQKETKAPDIAKAKGKAKENQKKKKKKKEKTVDQAEVDQAYQETLRTLEQGASRSRQRRRRRKRDEVAAQRQKDLEAEAEQAKILRVTEFVSTGELANLMDVQVNELISLLFASGMMVSINQRLDADTISFVGDEFGFEVEFITEFGTDDIELEEDDPENLVARAPVVTIMGHVDHGKTSLLDYLRSANVVAGEAGGITQHIGAYHVQLPDQRQITFLDTPGHEAFTAMRARGAQVTDIVILVVAADDSVMPQTIEAINHAKAADVPILVAINKMDKADANAPRVMQELAEHGVLVEQYGGKIQCSLVSAKTGDNIPELLEKVLLEADILELKANPERVANGVVIESRLDKGRGTVATVLVQNGTLSVGDTFIAGIFSGRVRAMFDERDHRVNDIGPALPALVLGFNGAPEVGDQFVVMKEEREAREIAQKRQQIHREQTLRQRKHITLDEIGRRLALGDFQELNLIVKADVGGSVEALSDSLLKLSTQEVAVNIIHSGVGAITESDVMLASASDAVIIGFQVRPTSGARAVAEREEIDVRTYSIIYDAIEDVRDALEGLLSPEESEKITGGAEVREIFKVPRVGTVAGCYVIEGRIRRSDKVRLIRDGIVIYSGGLSSLKRFKDDVREVVNGYECGIGMENYNDIKVGDVFEAFEIVETKRKLEA